MKQITARLLGHFHLAYNDQPVALPQPRLQSLLAYLLLHRETPQTRQHLASLFWPETGETQARTNLRNLLFQLRTAWPQVGQVLHIERKALRWQADTEIDLDVATLQAAEQTQTPSLGWVQSLYPGDLLPHLHDEWLNAHRDELRAHLLRLLHRLATDAAKRDALDDALAAAELLLRHDPSHEEIYRLLMTLHAAAGQRAQVDQTYRRCVEALAEELDVPPADATTKLYRALLAGEPTTDQRAIGTPNTHAVNPALGEPTARLHRFPDQSPLFVERPVLLSQIVAHLLDVETQLLTLLGLGGVGKTSIAVAAVRALATRSEFGDGIFFVDLAAIQTPAQMPLALASALDLSLHDQETPYQQLLHHLAPRRALLVLDNYEHLLPSVDIVAALLTRAPQVKLLVTSREALNLLAETRLLVDGLSHPGAAAKATPRAAGERYEAIELFRRVAVRIRPDLVIDEQVQGEIERICRLLDGSPLAIEMAAGWLRLYDPATICAQLEQSLDLLVAQKSNAVSRQQSVKAVLDQSWRLLAPAEQQILAQMSVFMGSFSVDAALSVTSADPVDLASLLDKTFLLRRGSRLRLHALLRQFAAEKLAAAASTSTGDSPAKQTRARHARFFIERLAAQEAALFGPTPAEPLDQLAADFDELRAAWLRASEADMIDLLTTGLPALVRLYEARFLLGEVLPLLTPLADQLATRLFSQEAVDEAAASAKAERLYTQLLLTEARICLPLNSLARGETLAEQAHAVALRSGDWQAQAQSQLYLGGAKRRALNFEQAEAHLQRALSLCPSDAARLQADIYGELGSLNRILCRFDQARDYRRRAYEIIRRLGDLKAEADLLVEAGLDGWDAWWLDEAQANFEQAFAIYRALGNEQRAMICRYYFGLLHHRRGRLTEARRDFEITLRAAEAWGLPFYQAEIQQMLSTVYLRMGDEEPARAMVEAAIAVNRAVGRLNQLADCLVSLAEIESSAGNYKMAYTHLVESREQYAALRLPRGVIYASTTISRICRQAKEYKRAQAALGEALDYCREHDQPDFLPLVYLEYAYLALAQDDIAAADAWCRQATEHMKQAGTAPQFFGTNVSEHLVQEIRQKITEHAAS